MPEDSTAQGWTDRAINLGLEDGAAVADGDEFAVERHDAVEVVDALADAHEPVPQVWRSEDEAMVADDHPCARAMGDAAQVEVVVAVEKHGRPPPGQPVARGEDRT